MSSSYGRSRHNGSSRSRGRSDGRQSDWYADRVRRLRVAMGRILGIAQHPSPPSTAESAEDSALDTIAKIAEEVLEQERREDG